MRTVRRASDNGNGDDYKRRRFIRLDWNDTIKIGLILIGFGTAGATYFRSGNHEKCSELEIKLHNYIEKRKSEEILQNQIINNEIKHLNEKIDDIKIDLKEIKQLIRNNNR